MKQFMDAGPEFPKANVSGYHTCVPTPASDASNASNMPFIRSFHGEPFFRSLRASCGDGLMSIVETLSPVRAEPNPAFPTSTAEANLTLQRLAQQPITLPRPILLLNGYRGPDFQVLVLKEQIRRHTDAAGGDWLAVSYLTASDLPAMVRKVMRCVQQRWPDLQTVPGEAARRSLPLDVVAISMGGIVAKLAAVGLESVGLGGPGLARLNIARLFTLATPHQGAKLADKIAPDPAAAAVKFGSPLLARLHTAWMTDERLCTTEQVCYTRLDDQWVGATRAAPPGQQPIWLEGCGAASHGTVSRDPRILADLALRLRGEPPLSQASLPPRD